MSQELITIAELSEEFGCHRSTITRALKGIDPIGNKGRSKAYDANIARTVCKEQRQSAGALATTNGTGEMATPADNGQTSPPPGSTGLAPIDQAVSEQKLNVRNMGVNVSAMNAVADNQADEEEATQQAIETLTYNTIRGQGLANKAAYLESQVVASKNRTASALNYANTIISGVTGDSTTDTSPTGFLNKLSGMGQAFNTAKHTLNQ